MLLLIYLLRRLRNLEETQEELNLTIEQYAEINRYRGIKVLQEGYYTRKVDRDKLFKILYVAEVAKAENIYFMIGLKNFIKNVENIHFGRTMKNLQ